MNPFLRLVPFLLAASATATGQTPLFTVDGPGQLQTPQMVAAAGDIDRDGRGDMLVSRASANRNEIGVVDVVSGRTGRKLFSFRGTRPGDGFGFAVAGGGDVNRDGWPDAIVGAPRASKNGTLSGAAFVISGKDQRILHAFYGAKAGDSFGWSVAIGGDVNRDGAADLIVGAPNVDGSVKDVGLVRVFDGFSGRLLYSVAGTTGSGFLGLSVAFAGDTDKDGHADFMAGAPGIVRKGGGKATVWSGKWGTVLHTFTGITAAEPAARIVAGIGDVDGDGHDDVAFTTNNGNAPFVRVRSGKTGKALTSLQAPMFSQNILTLGPAGDVDRDGRADVVICADQIGEVQILSAVRSQVIWRFRGASQRARETPVVAAAGIDDINGDGKPDVLVAERRSSQAVGSFAYVFAVNFKSLSVQNPTVSVGKGGTALFNLSAGRAHAGRLYLLLGSEKLAVFPGTALGPVRFPLVTSGAYFDFTLVAPNVPPLVGSIGFLNGAGEAVAAFRLPPNSPFILSGLKLHHSFVALGAGPVFASEAATVQLIQ